MDGFFDIDAELLSQEDEQNNLHELFITSNAPVTPFQTEAFFDYGMSDTVGNSFDEVYMDLLLEQATVSKAVDGSSTTDKVNYTEDIVIEDIIEVWGTINDGGSDSMTWEDFLEWASSMGYDIDDFDGYGDDSSGDDTGDDGPSTDGDDVPPTPPDEIIVTATIIRHGPVQVPLSPDFDIDDLTDIDIELFDINIPIPCINIAPPTNATGLNQTHADVLRDLLSALENVDVVGTFTDSNGVNRSVNLSTIMDSTSNIQWLSGDLPDDLQGRYDIAAGTVTIDTANTGLYSTLNTIIHEAIHVWAQLNGIPQDPAGGGHAAWVEPLANALRDAILRAEPSAFDTSPGDNGCSS